MVPGEFPDSNTGHAPERMAAVTASARILILMIDLGLLCFITGCRIAHKPQVPFAHCDKDRSMHQP